jgi:hypothetical protein
MVDANLLKHRTVGAKAQTLVKTLGLGLSVKLHGLVAPKPGQVYELVQHGCTNALLTSVCQNGQSANFGDASLCGQQATSG